jgi:hypothetical protein
VLFRFQGVGHGLRETVHPAASSTGSMTGRSMLGNRLS